VKTTYLDLVGVTCLCLFAYAIWPPALLLAAGAAALVASWSLTR
jgi:hypothetical protein